jgi:hypothetical protein
MEMKFFFLPGLSRLVVREVILARGSVLLEQGGHVWLLEPLKGICNHVSVQQSSRNGGKPMKIFLREVILGYLIFEKTKQKKKWYIYMLPMYL